MGDDALVFFYLFAVRQWFVAQVWCLIPKDIGDKLLFGMFFGVIRIDNFVRLHSI